MEVCRYDACLKQLNGSRISKARKFNRLKRIEPLGRGMFLVKPILGYNHTTYEVNTAAQTCNCQANERSQIICSHLMACWLYEKQNS